MQSLKDSFNNHMFAWNRERKLTFNSWQSTSLECIHTTLYSNSHVLQICTCINEHKWGQNRLESKLSVDVGAASMRTTCTCTVLSLTSASPLITTPLPLKRNLFISPHDQKPHLYYKMPQNLVKLNGFLGKRQKQKKWWQNTYRKARITCCNEKFGKFLFWRNERPVKGIFRAPGALTRENMVYM